MEPAASGPASPEAPLSVDRSTLWLVALAALTLRLAFLALEPAVDPKGDEQVWVKLAHNLCERSFSPLRTSTILFHPPLYPYFLAVPLYLTGSLAVAKCVQVVVASLLVPAVGLVGGRLFGGRAGLAAAILVALYPDLIWLSAHFWVESLFLVIVWWGFERLFAADSGQRMSVAVVAGLLWGLGVLARETLLYLVPVAAVWLGFRRARGWPRALAFTGAALLVVAPWTYRNWRVFRAFVPVSTAGGLNLFQGNARLSRDEVYQVYYYGDAHGHIAQYHLGLREGLAAIRDRQPTWAFEKLREQMPMFWEAESMALIHVKRGAYGPARGRTAVIVALVVLVPYVVLLALFVAGLAGARWDRRLLLLIAFLLVYNALHVVTHGFNRYRLPVMPVLFLFGGWAWEAWRGRHYPPLGPRRKLLAAALAVLFGLCVLPSLRTQIHHEAFRGVPSEVPEAMPPSETGAPDAGSEGSGPGASTSGGASAR